MGLLGLMIVLAILVLLDVAALKWGKDTSALGEYRETHRWNA